MRAKITKNVIREVVNIITGNATHCHLCLSTMYIIDPKATIVLVTAMNKEPFFGPSSSFFYKNVVPLGVHIYNPIAHLSLDFSLIF